MNTLMISQNYIPRSLNTKQNQINLNGKSKRRDIVVQGRINYINRNNYYAKNYSRYTHYYVVDYKDIYGRFICRRIFRRPAMVVYNGRRYVVSTIGNNKYNSRY